MTEATYTVAEYEDAERENALIIPWFLDAKNPENVKRRLARAKLLVNKTPKKVTPKRVSKPAKSVATMPTAEAEQPAPKPAKAKPAKATPPAPKAASMPTKGKLNGDAIIRVLVTEFGHKAGSKAETKSAALKDGMTVAEYMALDLGFAGKWHSSHISHCVGKKFIKLEDAK